MKELFIAVMSVAVFAAVGSGIYWRRRAPGASLIFAGMTVVLVLSLWKGIQ